VALHRPLVETYHAVLTLLKLKPGPEPIPESLKQQAHFVHLLMPETAPELNQSSMGKN
jgi:hypothetical protein